MKIENNTLCFAFRSWIIFSLDCTRNRFSGGDPDVCFSRTVHAHESRSMIQPRSTTRRVCLYCSITHTFTLVTWTVAFARLDGRSWTDDETHVYGIPRATIVQSRPLISHGVPRLGVEMSSKANVTPSLRSNSSAAAQFRFDSSHTTTTTGSRWR